MRIGRAGLAVAVAGGAGAGLALGAGFFGTSSDAPAADLARGAAIYAEACAACHGARLEGQPDWKTPLADGRMPAPPHDATGHTWHHPDRVLLAIMRDGAAAVIGRGYESDMPGFGEVYSEAELRDVLEWIKTHWPEAERRHQARMTEQDRTARRP